MRTPFLPATDGSTRRTAWYIYPSKRRWTMCSPRCPCVRPKEEQMHLHVRHVGQAFSLRPIFNRPAGVQSGLDLPVWLRLCCFVLSAALATLSASAQPGMPAAFQKIGIDQRLNNQVPPQTILQDEEDRKARLGHF